MVQRVPSTMLEQTLALQSDLDDVEATLTASLSTLYTLDAGVRNKIINGCCRVAQRGPVAAVNNALTYGGADRIAIYPANFTTLTSGTIQQVTNTGNNTASNCAQVLGGLTTTGVGAVHFVQRLEAAHTVDLSGRMVTVSARVFQDTGADVAVQMSLHKATVTDNFAATTQVDVNKNPGNAVNNAYTTLSATFQLGAGDGNTGLMLFVSFTSIGAVTTKNFYLGDFQMVVGGATPTMQLTPLNYEIARCQRYYEKSYDLTTNPGTATTTAAVHVRPPGATHDHSIEFKTLKRTAPTMTGYNSNSGATGTWRDNTAGADRALVFANAGHGRVQIQLAGLVVANQVTGHWTASCEL